MKTQFYKKLILTFLFIAITYAGWSQQTPDSLLKYLEIAVKNNPGVLQKFNEYQAALQRIPQAGSLSDPELSAGYYLKPMMILSGYQVANFGLMQMFPWFGTLKFARNEMSLMSNAEFETFRDAQLQVCYEVQRTWYKLFKIRNSISISEKNIEILGTIERLALVKFQSAPSSGKDVPSASSTGNKSPAQDPGSGSVSGMQSMGNMQGVPQSSGSTPMQSGSGMMGSSAGGLADLYRIQIETGDLQNSIVMMENQYITTLAQFNSYLNRPSTTSVFIPDSVPLDTLTIPLISASDSILINNPMLRMLEYEKRSIETKEKMIKKMSYPMIGLGLNYTLIKKDEMSESPMNGKDMLMPMVTVSLPIYRKKYNAMITEAELLKTATSNNYNATVNTLQTEYYMAIESYQDAKRRVKLYDRQFQLASKSLDLTIRGFGVSTSSLTDLLRIRQQTLDYELKQAEAIADLNSATALLKRLMASSHN